MEKEKKEKTFYERLIDEEKGLHIKMIALSSAIKEGVVPKEEEPVLNIQLSAMTTYAYVLKLRIETNK